MRIFRIGSPKLRSGAVVRLAHDLVLQEASDICFDDFSGCPVGTEENEIFVGGALLFIAEDMGAALSKRVLFYFVAQLVPPVISVSLLAPRMDYLD